MLTGRTPVSKGTVVKTSPEVLGSRRSHFHELRYETQPRKLFTMNEIANRNYDIAAARLAGKGLGTLAAQYGLHINSISRIAQDNAVYVRRRDGRRVPDKLTARAAVTIEDALGIWPTDGNIHYVAERWYSILRSPTRRAVLAEIREWVSLGR